MHGREGKGAPSRRTSEDPPQCGLQQWSHGEMMRAGTKVVGDAVKKYLVDRSF